MNFEGNNISEDNFKKKLENLKTSSNKKDEEKSLNINLSSFNNEVKTNNEAKTSFGKKVLITFLVYISLFCVSFFIYFIFVNSIVRIDFWEVLLTFLIFGVSGVYFGVLFLFPYSPLLFSLIIIFIIVDILERRKIITSHKKIFWLIFAISLFLFAGTKVFDSFRWYFVFKQVQEERSFYKEKYETDEIIESISTFIYPEGNEIIKSDIYGNNKEVIYSYPGDEDIEYVSPNGRYFVVVWNKEKDGKILQSVDNSSPEINLCKIINNSCPSSCDWDYSSSSFACKYATKRVLFDVNNGKHKIIIQSNFLKTNNYNAGFQDFSFIDRNTFLFIDRNNNNKFYKAENIYSCSMKITEMNNLIPCENFILNGDEIYCSVKASDYNIEIEDKENIKVGWREYFIIRQKLNQNSNQDYEVINKAPVAEPEILSSIDNNFIFVVSTDHSEKIINIESGLIRDVFVDEDSYEKIESDKNLILKDYGGYNGEGKILRIFRKDDSIEKVSIQECGIDDLSQDFLLKNENIISENNENLPVNLIKWENDKLAFKYNENKFNIVETADEMIHLKDKTDNLKEYANISTYKIENGLTFDMIFNNTKNMGEKGGYFDITKKKIGNREFVVYSCKINNESSGKTINLNYETTINDIYHLSVGNNFSFHEFNEESVNEVEKIIESIQIKEY